MLLVRLLRDGWRSAQRTSSMPIYSSATLKRRQLLVAGTALGVTAALPFKSRSAFSQALMDSPRRMTVAPARVSLVGKRHPATAAIAYDGAVPGPVLRVPQGELFQIVVENRLSENTTVHWHGIRLPNAMDGVPGLTQPPIEPGASFTYVFTPPDAGTFWYHPHDNSLVQIGSGLAGAFIVDEAEPPRIDHELLWVVQDWRLMDDARIAPGFGNRMEAGMAGRIGNTITINGRVPDILPVRAGERIRLRIVNAAGARIMALGFSGHRPIIIALNGQPCDPHAPKNGRLVLGPAMRADMILDMSGKPGSRHTVTDDFYGDELAYSLIELVYDLKPPLRAHPLDAPIRLAANPLPKLDLASAERHDIALQGGMMSGMGMMGMGMRGASWAINGMSMTGDGEANMPPLLTLRRGITCVLALKNETAWWHPMHLHGHSFKVLTRDDTAAGGAVWGDTVLVPPRQTIEIAFVADNPGDWMLHCHVMDHQVAGMMTVLRVA
jgi:FtsP/CotA-like multicopper oxidase with cupredoxin domain